MSLIATFGKVLLNVKNVRSKEEKPVTMRLKFKKVKTKTTKTAEQSPFVLLPTRVSINIAAPMTMPVKTFLVITRIGAPSNPFLIVRNRKRLVGKLRKTPANDTMNEVIVFLTRPKRT